MEREFEGLTDRQILALIGRGLDALTDDRLRLPGDAEQLALLQDGIRLGARVQAWQQQLAASVDASSAAWTERGCSPSTWLAESMNLTTGEAKRLIKAGKGLRRFPIIADAALAGAVLAAQAEAITGVLEQLPKEFDAATVTEAQQLMVGFADSHNSHDLRHLTAHLVEVLSPETGDELDAKRLERQEGRAQSRRFLDFRPDGDGSMLIRGSLPVADAEPFIQIVEAYAAAEKRGIERLDPNSEYVTSAMRRADGLLAMARTHAQQSHAPSHGGDRPRIVITLSHDKLAKHCTDLDLGARLTRSGEPLPASVVRQLLCDAEILPMVLGSRSEPLDVGRSQRLVTPTIRAALEVRDGGCVFPGCNAPPEACEAHHIIPWYLGGPTSLTNLVLLCKHHHGICEPARPDNPPQDRWQIRLRQDQIAEIIPPRRVDHQQRPRLHARFTTRS
jgi:hypothetical protein